MNENKPMKGFIKEDEHGPAISGFKDGILYTASLMAVITIANYYGFGVYIQDAKLVFIEYLLFGLSVFIVHMISDKISVYMIALCTPLYK